MNEQVSDRDTWSDRVRRVEDAGIDVLLVRDHLAAEPFGPQLAPLAMLATAAALTTRLRVGSLVLDNDYRHPAFVAHEAATIDLLSGGRLELGLGAGWLRAEYDAAGIAFEPASKRIARLEEALPIIDRLLSGETVSFAGRHYTVDSLVLPIRPVQRPRPPLLVGGGGPKLLAVAARHADIVGILPAPIRAGSADVDDPSDRKPAAVEAKLEVLRAAAPHRFDSLELSLFATFVLTDHRRRDTQALIDRRGWSGVTVEEVWAMPSLFIGSVQQIRDDLSGRRRQFGVSYFVTSDLSADDVATVIAAG